MGKIRPSRIFKGWRKMITNAKDNFAKDRLKVCNKCPEKNKLTGTCNICGCLLKAKVKVIEEYCPMNKWKDIKEFKDRGLAVKLHDTDIATIEENENGSLTVSYKKPFKLNQKISDTKLTLELINCRGDHEEFEYDTTLNNIRTSICSCFSVVLDKTSLKEAESAKLILKYNTKLEGEINKRLKIKTDKDIFVIALKGEVK